MCWRVAGIGSQTAIERSHIFGGSCHWPQFPWNNCSRADKQPLKQPQLQLHNAAQMAAGLPAQIQRPIWPIWVGLNTAQREKYLRIWRIAGGETTRKPSKSKQKQTNLQRQIMRRLPTTVKCASAIHIMSWVINTQLKASSPHCVQYHSHANPVQPIWSKHLKAPPGMILFNITMLSQPEAGWHLSSSVINTRSYVIKWFRQDFFCVSHHQKVKVLHQHI